MVFAADTWTFCSLSLPQESGHDGLKKSPSGYSCASVELYNKTSGPEDKEKISIKSEFYMEGDNTRRISIVNIHGKKVGGEVRCQP